MKEKKEILAIKELNEKEKSKGSPTQNWLDEVIEDWI